MLRAVCLNGAQANIMISPAHIAMQTFIGNHHYPVNHTY